MEKKLFENFLNTPAVLVVDDGGGPVVYRGKIIQLFDEHLFFRDFKRTEFVFSYSCVLKLRAEGAGP